MKRWPWLIVLAVIVALAALASTTFQKDRDASEPQRPFADSTPGLGDARAQDRATQSHLRNAMTAEKTIYTDTQAYTDDAADLRYIESSLDWGGTLHVFVAAEPASVTPDQVVCLDEVSESGTTFSIADVAMGPYAGTYFGTAPCPGDVSPMSLAGLGTSWP